MINRYLVSFNARKSGALGIGETYRVQVDADSPEQACELGRAKGYSEGLEHIHTPQAKPTFAHWVYGSGMCGCLYDSGPSVSETLGGAIDGVLAIFADEMTEAELEQAKADLRLDFIHYFTKPQDAGAHYCEVQGCDCADPKQHDPEFDP